jgi:hypothetical protein
MTVVRRALAGRGVLAVGVSLVLGLSGCAGGHTPSPASGEPIAEYDAVMPDVAGNLDKDSAGKEAVRLADAIQALVPASAVVHVDDHARYVKASEAGAAYYGVIRTITLEDAVDAAAQSEAVISSLEGSGWTRTQTTEAEGLALTALVSSVDPAAWLLLIGGDAAGDEQVLTMRLASPDLP